jgi:hypothetical protein
MSTSSGAAEGGTNGFIYVVAAVAAMGGLLFIADDFKLSDTAQQIVVASLLLGLCSAVRWRTGSDVGARS